MNSSRLRCLAVALSCLFAGAVLTAQTTQVPNPSKTKAAVLSPSVKTNFGHLPLSFEKNVGQTAPSVQWLARGPESTLYLSGNDATVQINHMEKVKNHGIEHTVSHSASLRMSLLNAQPAASSLGEGLQSGKVNYFTGKDPSSWQRNLPIYDQIRLSEVYRGVSLLYHGEHGKLEYDFVVAPNADPTRISLGFTGARPSIAANGELVLPIDGDEKGESTVHFDRPVAYQTIHGVRSPVDSGYQVAENGHVSFHLGAYDHSRELVIDPTLVYTGTATTGSESDTPYGMAVDPSGELIIVGTTLDLNFPATSGAYQTSCGPMSSIAMQNGISRCAVGDEPGVLSSAYVMKLSADGTQLVYATYLHGLTGGEEGALVQSDASGNAIVVGQTSSNDFPLVNAPNIPQMSECQPYYKPYTGTPGASESICDGNNAGGGTEFTVGGPSGFVSKLSSDGSKLLYSAFLGYTGATYPEALALDSAGNMYIASNLVNADIAPQYAGNQEVFYYTTANALQAYGVGDQEIGFTVLSTDGQTVKYSTIFGETEPTFQGCGSCLGGTVAAGIAVSSSGQVYLAGETISTMLPGTSGTVQPNCIVNTSENPGQFPGTQPLCLSNAGFLAAFNLSKSQPFQWTTYLTSGTNTDNAALTNLAAVATDSAGNAYVTGYTTDALFPVTKGSYATTCAADTRPGPNFCDNTVFITKINSTGKAYEWSTFLNPTQSNASAADSNAIVLDAKGNIYIYGDSGTGTIPAVNPVTQYPNLWYQPYAFVSVLDPTGSTVLFSSQIAPSGNQVSAPASMHNGLALDSSGNMYMVGLTHAAEGYSIGSTNLTAWPTTKGTYSTAVTGTGPIPFFAKLTAVLPAPSFAFSISPTTATTGQTVTFNIAVTGPADAAIPTGSVNLNYTTSTNSTPTLLKDVALSGTGKDTYTTSTLAAGTYTFTAVYSGDTNYDSSTSSTATVTITTPVTASLTLTSSGSPVAAGASVTFTAKATGGGATPTGTVTFLDGTTTLGTSTISKGVATYSTSTLGVGTHSITASYSGDTNYVAVVSSAFTETIANVTFTVSYNPNPVVIKRGNSGTTTISVTPSVAYTGTITLGCNGTSISVTCTFNPTALAWTSSQSTDAQTSALTIQTTAPHSAAMKAAELGAGTWAGSLGLAFFLLLWTRKHKAGKIRQRLVLMVLLIASAGVLIGFSGCGGGSLTGGTPTGTQSLSVTFNGTDNGTPLSITIQ